MPYFILNPFPIRATPLHGGHNKQDSLRAGLLASGSTSGRVFPSFKKDSDVERPLFPVTAAGPRRTRTVFPIAFKGRSAGMALPIIQRADAVKGNMPHAKLPRIPSRYPDEVLDPEGGAEAGERFGEFIQRIDVGDEEV